MLVALTELKQHLRVDHDADDDLILSLSDAAEDYVGNYLNRPDLEAWGEHGSPVGSPQLDPLPAAVLHGIKMVVADLYANREAFTYGVQSYHNPAVDRLLYPYRVCLGV